MAHIEWEWIDEGFHEILNCDKLADMCFEAAEEIASKANETAKNDSPYTTNPFHATRTHSNVAGGRVAARVSGNRYADNMEAGRKALSKAVSACRH